jgi:hypothetical protein
VRQFPIEITDFLSCPNDRPQIFNADELQALCKENSDIATVHDIGAFDFDLTFSKLSGIKDRTCIPQGVKAGEVRCVSYRSVEIYPEKRHWVGAGIVAGAAAEVSPCK